MRDFRNFGEYDAEQLKQAREHLAVVLNYNHDDANKRRLVRRLKTIIKKIDELIKEETI